MTNIFDIFNGIVSDLQTTKYTTFDPKKELDEITKVNGIDMKDVTEEDFNSTMEYLDELKKNDFVTMLLGDEFIDKFEAELQAKWDIAHPDEKEGNEVEESPVDKRIRQLVDEYVESLKLPDTELAKYLGELSKEAYVKFAKFIYNHE